MKANGLSIACCALAALALGACSGDSQPTGPETGGTMLHRDPAYAYVDDGQDLAAPPPPDTSTNPGPTQPPPPPPPPPQDETGGDTDPTTGTVLSYPIDKFLASQGTFCADDGMGGCSSYMKPTANYLGWFNRVWKYSAAVDYAGIANNWLMQSGRWIGTQINGAVTEEQLTDGRARVTVDLHGANVLSFITMGTDYQASTYFGSQPWALVDPSVAPAIGNVQMRVTFINPGMGMPMPDLMQLVRAPLPGQKLESLTMRYEGDGQLATGEVRHVMINYDGSLGPIYPSHPGSPSTTPAMGVATIAIM
jgi:hypothetical protein